MTFFIMINEIQFGRLYVFQIALDHHLGCTLIDRNGHNYESPTRGHSGESSVEIIAIGPTSKPLCGSASNNLIRKSDPSV